jgi:hypothetical protein
MTASFANGVLPNFLKLKAANHRIDSICLWDGEFEKVWSFSHERKWDKFRINLS